MKHTPGKWIVGSLDRNEQRQVVSEVGSLVAVCAHECLRVNEPIMEANARLIAAAPELLEALKGIMQLQLAYAKPKHIDGTGGRRDEVFDRVAAAIAKAEGKL